MHLGQGHGRHLVVESVNYIEGCNEIEGVGRKGKSERRRAGHQPLSLRTGVGEAAEREIDAERAAVFAQHAQVVPGPAPAVEDAGAGAAGRGLREQGPHEAPEAVKPEVLAFRACRRVEKAIHQRLS